MADTADIYARSVSMALDAILKHLFRVLQDKGILTPAEIKLILAEAKTDLEHPQTTDFQLGALSIVQLMIDEL